jgi:hypothetical protein
MRPLKGVVLLLIMMAPALTGCAASGPSSPSGTVPPTAAAPTAASPTVTTTPGWTVASARLAYDWRWPNADGGEARVSHDVVVPVPQLTTISVGDHPNDADDPPYNRISFSFTTGYPAYSFQFVSALVADGSGQPIPLEGLGVVRIVFTRAQAHTDDGTASTITSRPPAQLGLSRLASYAQAGDFEGYLTYGLGIAWPIPESNPQIQLRVSEVTYVNGPDHRYVIAFDVDAS